MYISDAIRNAKIEGLWIVNNKPTSVKVEFFINSGKRLSQTDFTELDLYSDNKEKELDELWTSLCKEFDSYPGYVVSVEAYGYLN